MEAPIKAASLTEEEKQKIAQAVYKTPGLTPTFITSELSPYIIGVIFLLFSSAGLFLLLREK